MKHCKQIVYVKNIRKTYKDHNLGVTTYYMFITITPNYTQFS